MDQATANQRVEGLLKPGAGHAPDDYWKDPKEVATTSWRSGALDRIADSELGGDGIALIELSLNEPHPAFQGIVRVDEQGIWYADGDGSVQDPTWRLRLLPWRHIDHITLHQVS